MTDNIRIVIVDDHDLFREGIVELLKKNEGIEVVKSLASGRSFLEFLKTAHEVDIVLLDISMPKMNGFEVLDKVKALELDIKTIVISMHGDGNYIAKCAKSGASGYLLKNADEFELITAIKTVYNGRKYFNAEISEKMINFMSSNSVSEDVLSKKEHEVLQLIAEGFTTKQIASKLFVSARTIETHRANIIKKLDVKNTAQLIKKAAQRKLI